jgi:hypothetical protein
MEEPARINGPADMKKLLDEKGKQWLVAAMVEGSIGYHTPRHAEILIERAISGETKDWCERCYACFGRDLFEMIILKTADNKIYISCKIFESIIGTLGVYNDSNRIYYR